MLKPLVNADLITTTASENVNCKLRYKTFFKNGTEATFSNS
jgi:hypothetical protein